MLYSIFRLLLIAIFKLLFRFEVEGREQIIKKGGFILASNHRSFLDPLVLGVAAPGKLNFMAREDLFHNFAFGWLMRRVGAFPLRRDRADFKAIREGIKRLKDNKALVVFPEGTRSEKGEFQESYPGVGLLAIKANVPIIPVYIEGTDEALPKGERFIRLKKISVYFGLPIFTERRQSYAEISKLVMERIRHLYADKAC